MKTLARQLEVGDHIEVREERLRIERIDESVAFRYVWVIPPHEHKLVPWVMTYGRDDIVERVRQVCARGT